MVRIWAMGSPEALYSGDGSDIQRVGSKTPGAEHHVPFYHEIFGDTGIHFVYCIRNPFLLLASLRHMPWCKTYGKPNMQHIEFVVDRYKESLKAVDEMSLLPNVKVFDFCIDQMNLSVDERLAYGSNLLGQLGLTLDEGSGEFLQAAEKVNKAEEAASVKSAAVAIPEDKLSAFTDKELDFFSQQAPVQAVLKRFDFPSLA